MKIEISRVEKTKKEICFFAIIYSVSMSSVSLWCKKYGKRVDF
jgi:hypothetical protein